MIYCRGMYLGYYDYNKKEWALRDRFKLFFSENQLRNIIEQIVDLVEPGGTLITKSYSFFSFLKYLVESEYVWDWKSHICPIS